MAHQYGMMPLICWKICGEIYIYIKHPHNLLSCASFVDSLAFSVFFCRAEKNRHHAVDTCASGSQEPSPLSKAHDMGFLRT